MSSYLKIGGLSICGVVGSGEKIEISVQECWSIYCKWVDSLAEKDSPLCIIKNVKWTINDKEIEEPKAWFLVLENN